MKVVILAVLQCAISAIFFVGEARAQAPFEMRWVSDWDRSGNEGCPAPRATCEASLEISGVAAIAGDLLFAERVPLMGGIVIQEVTTYEAWVECGPSPQTSTWTEVYYELLTAEKTADPDVLVAGPDVFSINGPPGLELVHTKTGVPKFIPFNEDNLFLIRALVAGMENRISVQNPASPFFGSGPVVSWTSTNPPMPTFVTLPRPPLTPGSGLGLTSGGIPNQTTPPLVILPGASGGCTDATWFNDYCGKATSGPPPSQPTEHVRYLGFDYICCGGPGDYASFACTP